MTSTVEIRETYRDWEPPVNVVNAARRLLDAVPEKFRSGLGSVVLTNASGLNHSDRRKKTRARGRKVSIVEAAGLYHQAWRGEPAWIEIFVDNVFKNVPWLVLALPVVRDILLGGVLFHELGHHIHKTQAPEFREREDVADSWKMRFLVPYLERRYWYLARPVVFAARLVRKVGAKLMPNRAVPADAAKGPPRG